MRTLATLFVVLATLISPLAPASLVPDATAASRTKQPELKMTPAPPKGTAAYRNWLRNYRQQHQLLLDQLQQDQRLYQLQDEATRLSIQQHERDLGRRLTTQQDAIQAQQAAAASQRRAACLAACAGPTVCTATPGLGTPALCPADASLCRTACR